HICADERRRTTKFVYGLHGAIRSRIASQCHQTLASALMSACVQEQEQKRFMDERKTSQKPYVASSSSQDRKRKQQRPVAAAPAAQRQATILAVPSAPRFPVCVHCGKAHGGTECFRAAGKCYNCGEKGHISKDCTKPRTKPARVFAVTAEEAQAADGGTEGTILIDGFHAKVLFDSGATDSFVSSSFAELLCNQSGRVVSELDVPLPVISPGGSLSVTRVLSDIDVHVEGRSLLATVHVLELHDYDVILGMDWLSRHHALLDCQKRRVWFREPGKKEVCFQCPRNRSN